MVIEDKQASSLDGQAVRARVKWFNIPKGFGFAVPEDTDIDAFLHITTLQRAGIRSIGEGALVECVLEDGPKGAQVREVVRILEAGLNPEKIKAAPHLMAPPAERKKPGNRDEKSASMNGTVKWYKQDKGFGFVTPDDGQKDIFIHKSCLERYQMDDLPPGMRLSMRVKIVPKGREVLDFTVIEG